MAVFDGTEEVATHGRSLKPGKFTLELEHILRILEQKPRAASEATVIRQLGLPPCFEDLRQALRGGQRRRSDKEWVQIRDLLLDHPLAALTAAIEMALERGVPDLSSVRQILRKQSQPRVAAELTTTLVESKSVDRLSRKLDQLARFDLVIIDELGYVP